MGEPRYMRPFFPDRETDDDCPKCGSGGIDTQWFASYVVGDAAKKFFNGYPPNQECIGRKCRICGYAWPEAPINPDD